MNRRSFVALLSTPVLVALVEACSSDAATTSTAVTGRLGPGGSEVRSKLALTPTSPIDAMEASNSVDVFGMNLYRWLATVQPSGNLVFSPVSIATALTMVSVGAVGATLDQLVAALGIESADTIHHAMNGLTAELGRRSRDDITIAIANSLWLQEGTAVEQRFLDILSTEYNAGIHLIDYVADPQAARTAMNDWVDGRTEGRIPTLLAPNTISAASRLTLVNAVYLKAPWLQTFDPISTRAAPFTSSDGASTKVQMMAMSSTLPYATGDGWQAIELAYDSDDLTMLVFLPEPGTLGQFEQIFLLSDATPYLSPTEVAVQLPRFDIQSALALADVLQSLGIVAAFGADGDFSKITTEEPLHISEVVHQANVTVDEGGTEAAAATAVAMETGAMPTDGPGPVLFTADRPFVFAIRDRGTEAILFIGRVDDPTA